MKLAIFIIASMIAILNIIDTMARVKPFCSLYEMMFRKRSIKSQLMFMRVSGEFNLFFYIEIYKYLVI